MTDMNSQAKMVFDIALANEWYAVVPAVFKGNLKDVLVEKYIRTLIDRYGSSGRRFLSSTNHGSLFAA